MFNVVLTYFLAAIFRERVSCQAHMLLKKKSLQKCVKFGMHTSFLYQFVLVYFYFNASTKFTHHVQQTYIFFYLFFMLYSPCNFILFKIILLKINNSWYSWIFFYLILYLPLKIQNTRFSFCVFNDCFSQVFQIVL